MFIVSAYSVDYFGQSTLIRWLGVNWMAVHQSHWTMVAGMPHNSRERGRMTMLKPPIRAPKPMPEEHELSFHADSCSGT
jgi:hypothetical protein